jgi:predicted aspartyl protease
MRVLALLLLLAACAPQIVPGSPEACRVEKITAVPLIPPAPPDTTRWAIEVMLDGKPARMMLDSGAGGLLVSTEAAQRLGLRHRPDYQSSATGLGGMVYRRVFQVGSIAIGEQRRDDTRFAIEMTASQLAGHGFDGIVGMAVFDRNDVEIDFPARTLTLYRARFCPNGSPPWAGRIHGYARTDSAAHSRTNLPTVSAALDGHAAHALLDTGATSTVIDLAFARVAGAPATPPEAAPRGVARTMSETTLPMWRHGFDVLTIGGLRVTRPQVWVVELGMTADMIVGLDILARLRMWISNGSDRVYLATPSPS